jgi:hypothetical protein
MGDVNENPRILVMSGEAFNTQEVMEGDRIRCNR